MHEPESGAKAWRIGMGIVRLEGEKILLRQMTYEDTDKIVEWRNNERVRSHLKYTLPTGRIPHFSQIINCTAFPV